MTLTTLGAGPTSATFDPATVSGLQAWFKADAGVLDASGNAITADGTAVKTWQDQSGNAKHAVQATVSLQPLYKTNIVGGKPVVRFDATDDAMTSSYSSTGTIRTVFSVHARVGAAVLTRCMIQGSSNWILGPYNSVQRFFNGSGFIGADPAVGQGVFQYVCAYQDGSLSRFYINGAQSGADGSAGLAMNTVNFGKAGFQNQPGDADVAEALFYNVALSAANITAINGYLAAKYGL